MLKRKLGKFAVDPHQSNSVRKEDGKELEYQKLLQAVMDLQKEKVSKKRKLQRVKKKRDTLLAEVGFLSWRYKYLMRMQYNRLAPEQNENSPTPDNLVLEPVILPQQNENENKNEKSPMPGSPVLEPVRVEKKLKSLLEKGLLE